MDQEMLNKISELSNQIARLEQELKGYIHDQAASEPIKYNIDKIKWELEEKVKNINEQYEIEKNNILKNILEQIEETGIDLEEYGLKDIEEAQENKEEQKEKLEEKSNNVEEVIVEETQQSVEENTTERVEKPVVSDAPKTGIVNPILAGKNEDKVEKNKEPEIEMLDLGKVKKISSESIKIVYNAKEDKYLVKNVNIDIDHFVFRKDIEQRKEMAKEKEAKGEKLMPHDESEAIADLYKRMDEIKEELKQELEADMLAAKGEK